MSDSAHMVSYWLAFFWGFFILASFIGWGAALNIVLFPAHRVDWGQRAAWGVALSVVVGGVLNLLQRISRTTILVYLGLGIAWCLASWVSRIRSLLEFKQVIQRTTQVKYWQIFLCGVLLVAALITVQYSASISGVQHWGAITTTMFNPDDDFESCFVFPEKMLQTGSMGRDPFSQRRLQASLGGKSFLDTFVLSMLSFGNLHILDPGLGLLIIVGLLLGCFKERGTSLWRRLGVLLFVLLIPPATGNITSLYIGLALFLSLARALEWPGFQTARLVPRLFIVAVLGAAICSLKSTLIPACGIFLACSFLCHLIGHSNRRTALAETSATAALVVAFTLPWMLSMRQSSGTLLYPLLGRGYHQSVYGTSPSPYSELGVSRAAGLILKHMTDASSLILLSLGLIYLFIRGWKISGREVPLALTVGALFGKITMTVATGGESAYRYSFPFVMAATLVLAVEIVSRPVTSRQGELTVATAPFAAWAAATFLVGSCWDASRLMYLDSLRNVMQSLKNVPLVSAMEIDEYKKLQQSIPQGEVILTRLDKPFLLDFRWNRVLIMDGPGEASLPPGMPLFRGSEALASYLASKSIRYVAYSYGDDAGFTRYFAYRLSPYNNVWDRTRAQHTFDVQDNLAELGKTRKRIYDDGKNFVLDLQQTDQ